MSDMQAKIGRSLLKGLVDLKQQKGEVSLEDVGGMFIQMASTINPTVSPADQFLHEEIGKLAAYISSAKEEIFAISTDGKSEAAITDASQHLDEVVKETEKATNTIMDAADKIQGAVAGIGGEKEKQITDATIVLYDACNFQDITGQRINKVIRLLKSIDERVTKLNSLFGTTTMTEAANANGKGVSEKDLLNGPQLASEASSQAEIDALFASLSGKS